MCKLRVSLYIILGAIQNTRAIWGRRIQETGPVIGHRQGRARNAGTGGTIGCRPLVLFLHEFKLSIPMQKYLGSFSVCRGLV